MNCPDPLPRPRVMSDGGESSSPSKNLQDYLVSPTMIGEGPHRAALETPTGSWLHSSSRQRKPNTKLYYFI